MIEYTIRPPTEMTVVVAQQPQQVPQQSPTLSTASGETLVLILCSLVVVSAWRKGRAHKWPLLAAIVVGTLLAGSVVGPMIKQTSGSAGTQMENMVSGVQNGGTGGGQPSNGNNGGGTP